MSITEAQSESRSKSVLTMPVLSAADRRAGQTMPRLSRRLAFWAVAFAFLGVSAFATTPSPLYGIYEHREHLSSLTITVVYAVYAAGIVISLLVVGHVSDWYGRRTVLLPALGVALVAAVVFLVWKSLAGLLVGRVLTGVSLGAAAATATAFITDLGGAGEAATRRSAIVSTSMNVGGLGVGALVAGILASYSGHPLALPFVVMLAALSVGVILVVLTPEGHPALHPRPKYHPQRLAAPANARRQFLAALIGVFTAFAVGGLFAGLTGTLLAGPLHHSSPALAGLTIFVTFGAGVLAQTTTTTWATHRLVAAGIVPLIVGLGLLVTSAWTSPPSLALFLISGAVAGLGIGAVSRGSLTTVIAISGAADRAGPLATWFTVGYVGVSLPVVCLGLALQHLSPRVTLLIFGLAAGLLILAAAPILVRPAPEDPTALESQTDAMTSMSRCHGVVLSHS